MSIVTPINQWISSYTWSTVKDPEDNDFFNSIAVIIDADQLSGLRLDDAPITWNNISVSDYDVVVDAAAE